MMVVMLFIVVTDFVVVCCFILTRQLTSANTVLMVWNLHRGTASKNVFLMS